MRVCSVVGVLVGLAGCGSPGEFGPDATWTVVVYGHGDHNLSPSLALDIEEMKTATVRGNVNVLVFADWDASQQGFPTGGQWLRVVGGEAEVVETVTEPDLDDPGVLAAAVEHGFALAPADRRALILWNHGGAWEGGFGGDTADGSMQGPGIMMPVAADAVRAGLDGAGVDRLDFVAFDTCLLGGVESAAEFVGLADLYIGNGELDYGDGLDYRALLSYLSDQPGTRIHDLAAADAAAYADHHRAEQIDRMLHAHVALDLTRMPDVMDRAGGLVAAIDSPEAALAVARAMFSAAPGYYNMGFSPEGTRAPGLHDLGQVADVLAGSAAGDVAAAARSLRDGLDDLVLANALGELRVSTQIGINVELTPAVDATPERLAEYESKAIAWNESTGWSSLISTVASFGDNNGPQVSGDVAPGGVVQFEAIDADIADVTFELGILEGDDEYGYGWVTAAAVPSGQPLDMLWSGEVWAMNTSAGFEGVYVAPWALSYLPGGSPNLGMMFTPGIIEGGADEELAMLMFDSATGNAPVFTIWNAAADTWTSRAVEEYRGRTFRPILPMWDVSGQSHVIRLGGISIDSGDLTVHDGTMSPGTYRLNLIAADVWGNASMLPLDVSIGPGASNRVLPTRVRRDAWLRRLAAAERDGNLRALIPTANAQPALRSAHRPHPNPTTSRGSARTRALFAPQRPYKHVQ